MKVESENSNSEVDAPATKKLKTAEDVFASLVLGRTVILKTSDGHELKASVEKLTEYSDVFKEMLSRRTKENIEHEISIDEFTGVVVVEFLRFIHCERVQNLELHAFELFKFSKKYMVAGLASITKQTIKQRMNVSMILETATLAHTYCMNELLDECCRIIQM